jgi:hypothetical protein
LELKSPNNEKINDFIEQKNNLSGVEKKHNMAIMCSQSEKQDTFTSLFTTNEAETETIIESLTSLVAPMSSLVKTRDSPTTNESSNSNKKSEEFDDNYIERINSALKEFRAETCEQYIRDTNASHINFMKNTDLVNAILVETCSNPLYIPASDSAKSNLTCIENIKLEQNEPRYQEINSHEAAMNTSKSNEFIEKPEMLSRTYLPFCSVDFDHSNPIGK